MVDFKIGSKLIGSQHRPYIIAEIAQAHDGSLGYAHAFIDLAKEIGVDAIKFQTHFAQEETTWQEEFRINIFPQDKTRYEYWKRMEFTEAQWHGLFDHAKEQNIDILSSAFSMRAVDLLSKLGMKAWKIASGEVTNLPLLEAMAKTGKPILLSSGMSSYEELDNAIAIIKKHNAPFGLFQCTSKYPTPLEETGLNIVQDFIKRYNCPVGLSDHSANPYVPIAAMAQGASMFEAHLCLHPHQFGPDTSSSLTPDQFKMVCEARDTVHTLNTHQVHKDEVSNDLERTRSLFNKSLALKENQPQGTVIKAEMLTLKKPGTGIPLKEQDNIIGLKLAQDKSCEHLLSMEDFEI